MLARKGAAGSAPLTPDGTPVLMRRAGGPDEPLRGILQRALLLPIEEPTTPAGTQ